MAINPPNFNVKVNSSGPKQRVAKVEPASLDIADAPFSKAENAQFDAVLGGQKLTASHQWEPILFSDSDQMLSIVMPNFTAGFTQLYDWQRETNKFLCCEGFTHLHPLQFILCACNGSGKDAYVVAPFVIWHCITKIRSKCIVTSASFNQLKTQTESAIRSIANAVNNFVGEKILLIKQFHIVCTRTGSEIKMFATDEAGYAEGDHPFPDYPNAEMAIVINEGKTVKDEIFAALRRCNGYNRWIEVSSPGRTSGHMFDMYCRSVIFPDYYVQNVTRWYSRKVTAYECPHISPLVIEDDKLTYGEHSPQFRSMYLAEFTSLEDAVVIPMEMLQKSLNTRHAPIKLARGVSAGIDLAFSLDGDETVGYCLDGNVIKDWFTTRMDDTILLKQFVASKLREWKLSYGLTYDNTYIDDGNAGRSIIDMLRADGISVNRVLNQSSAILKAGYANRGAELYWNVRRLVEESLLWFDSVVHGKLISQLTARHYGQHALNGKLVLESRQQARAKGHGSPDRADAFVLAFCGVTLQDFLLGRGDSVPEVPRIRFSPEDITSGKVEIESLLERMQGASRGDGKPVKHFNSLHSVMSKYRVGNGVVINY